MTSADLNSVFIWLQGDLNQTRVLSSNLNAPKCTFVTENYDFFVDNGRNHRIDKYLSNSSLNPFLITVPGQCTGLFIDHNNTIYCSLNNLHKITSGFLVSGMNLSRIIAGNGTQGSTSDLLKYPNGIYVDGNFTLYVADSGNHRIQRFDQGQTNGVTFVGTGGIYSFNLQGPFGIAFDDFIN